MADRDVLVAFDDSPASHAAIQWAALYAERSKRSLVIALSGDTLDPAEIAAGAVDESSLLINGIVTELRSEHPGLAIETVVADEAPVHLIERLGERCALVVVGADGDSRYSDAVFGSAAFHLAADATWPVVVIPADTVVWPPAHRPQRVVVGGSESANGAAAVRFAVRYAGEVGATVTIVRGGGGAVDDHAEPALDAQQLLDDLADLARRSDPQVPVSTQLVHGASEHAVRTAADGADLLVVGRRSSSRHLAEWTSLSARVAARPPCPVAIVGDPAGALAD